MTNETRHEKEQREDRESRRKTAGVFKRIITYPLVFEGLTRIAEANLPEYADTIRTIRHCGENIYGFAWALGAVCLITPLYGQVLAGEIYKGLRGK